MEIKNLLQFIDAQHQLLLETKQANETYKERVLARMVKIQEEVGELSDEILGSLGDQRKSKMESRDIDSLGDEFADVVFTTFILARMMEVDMEQAMEKKIQKIEAKHNKEMRAEWN